MSRNAPEPTVTDLDPCNYSSANSAPPPPPVTAVDAPHGHTARIRALVSTAGTSSSFFSSCFRLWCTPIAQAPHAGKSSHTEPPSPLRSASRAFPCRT